MRKGSDLIGKPVIAFGTGVQLEKVHDLVFDQNSNQLLALVVDDGGWFSSARVLPLQNIQTIGNDAVIVPSEASILAAEQVPSVQRILERNNILKGTKIMTTDGRDLGTLADLYFDEKTGAVEGYEASGGVFADAYSGRSFVPATQTLKIGEDVAFVPPEVADMMEEQVGGLKGAAQKAATTATNAAVDPAEQRAFVLGKKADDDVKAPDGTLLVAKGQTVTELAVQEAENQNAVDRLYRATGGSVVGAAVGGATAGASVDEAKGRRVTQAVRTDEGMVIAAPGQIVTDAVVTRARTYNREKELLAAVGLTPGEAVQQGASQAAAAVGGQVAATAQQAKEGASNLWDKVKEKVTGLQENSSQELEEQRIKRALGRPIDRVLLSPQDQVILNVGELITNKAVDEARTAGVLDILLSSVYSGEAHISEEEMRAPHAGDAALEPKTNPAT